MAKQVLFQMYLSMCLSVQAKSEKLQRRAIFIFWMRNCLSLENYWSDFDAILHGNVP